MCVAAGVHWDKSMRPRPTALACNERTRQRKGVCACDVYICGAAPKHPDKRKEVPAQRIRPREAKDADAKSQKKRNTGTARGTLARFSLYGCMVVHFFGRRCHKATSILFMSFLL